MAYTPIAIKDANSTSQNMGAYQDAAGNNYAVVSRDVNVATYRTGVSRITPFTAPTVVFKMPGNATTTVRIKEIEISGAATAAGKMPFTISKCSAAGTLGSATITAMTSVPLDSGSAAASSAAGYVQSANYTTVPTVVGVIYAGELELGALATGVCRPSKVTFGDNAQSLVLRGTSQLVTVEFLGTTLPSGTVMSATILWTEDAS